LKIFACADPGQQFVTGFVATWTMMMEPDRFDLA
jgi:catalase (peroxidase I)